MAYIRNIPAATDLISNSQPQIQGNFNIIDSGTTGTGTGFSRNHITLTDATNGGLHNRVDYYQAVADPAISGFVGSLYVKSVAQGGLSAAPLLVYNTGTPYVIGGALSATQNGFCYLPGGILLKWGVFTSSAGIANFTYPVGASIPVFSNVFNVQLTPTGASGSPDYFAYINGTPGTTSFSYDSTKRTSNSATVGTYFYLIIGN